MMMYPSRDVSSRGAKAGLILALALTISAVAPESLVASAAPVAKPALKASGKKHPHALVNKLDPSFKLATRAAVQSRAQAPAAILPASVLPAGNWTALGPQPIADEKTMNGPNPTSDFGPASGRVTSLVTDPANGSIVYAGTAGGGVWKSTDGGQTWATTMDSAPNLSIGALAIDAAGTTIYAATGEDNGNADSQWGAGILKSTDSGATWSQIGTAYAFATQTHIGGIAVDRTTSGANERVVLAGDSGLWVSANSGTTWSPISFPAGTFTALTGKTASGDFVQVLQSPAAPYGFWAVATDFCQTEAGDILISSDNNVGTTATWTAVHLSTASSGVSRIGLGLGGPSSVGQLPPVTAYAALAGNCSGSNIGYLYDIQKSTDGGNLWASVPGIPADYMTFPGSNPPESQGWYDNAVGVDPTNGLNAIFGGIDVVRTTDGGNSFSPFLGDTYNGGNIHPDFHALTFQPSSSAFYAGNDGGVWESSDLGTTWSNRNGDLTHNPVQALNTIQFYNGTSPDAQHVVGGAQDNGTPGILPGSPATSPSWQEYLDGDGGYTVLDPTAGSSTIYGTTSGGGIWRGSYAPPPAPDANWPYDTYNEADPCPSGSTLGAPYCDPSHTAFIAPVLMDQTNPSRLLTGTSAVLQSTNQGASWTAVSTSVISTTSTKPDFVASLAMGTTASTANTALSGSYYGKVYKTTTSNVASSVWTDISSGLPAFSAGNHVPGTAWISGIAFNESNPLEIWVTIGGINVGHVWHSADGGTTWSDFSGSGGTGISSSLPVNGIIFDPTGTATVFIATDLGVLACTTCSGPTATSATAAWSVVGSGLPHVRVNAITENSSRTQLYAWTHGRGAWVVPVGPVLDASPTQLTFSLGEGGMMPGAQTVTVKNDGVGTLNWTAASNPTNPPGWLNPPSPAAGTIAQGGTPQTVTISINTAAIPAAGTYQGSVTFSGNGGTTAVNVTLIVPAFPGKYQPLAPARILDTRSQYHIGPYSTPFGNGEVRLVPVAGQGPVPAMNSATPPAAVVLNVTATNTTQPGFLTVYPTGVPRPNASNLNFVPGQSVPNLVEVPLGADGNVDVYNFQGSTDVIFDVQGYVAAQNTVAGTAGLFHPLSPYRIMDTRTGQGGSGTIQSNASVDLQVAGTNYPDNSPGVPSSHVAGVVLNVTVTNPTHVGFVTVYPTGTTRPNASNLNFVAGQTVPNRVQVKLGTGGKLTIYNLIGTVDVVVDVNGWFTDGTDPLATGGQFTGVTPFRALDTRYGPGQRPPLGSNQSMALQVAGVAGSGVPAMNATVPPTSVVLNVTVTDTTQHASFLEVYPHGAALPGTSDLNWVPGETVPNLVVVKLGATGMIDLYNLIGTTDVVVDVFGWYD